MWKLRIAELIWPPWAKRMRNDMGWHIVSSAINHLLQHDAWDKGDYLAGKLLNQKMREMNGR